MGFWVEFQWVSVRVMELILEANIAQLLSLVSANFVGRLGGRPANRSLCGTKALICSMVAFSSLNRSPARRLIGCLLELLIYRLSRRTCELSVCKLHIFFRKRPNRF